MRRIFAAWCHDHGINLLNAKRPHLETFARWMEQEGRMASTIGRRLSTLSSFYRYRQTEDILDKNPALNGRRPENSLRWALCAQRRWPPSRKECRGRGRNTGEMHR
jgi:site-specific recombinase XerD